MSTDILITEPPAGVSKRAARHLVIVDYLVKAGSVTVEQLANVLDVSQVTIYRDIADLVAEQLVELHRGEVSAAPSSLTEASWKLRANRQLPAKQALASAAARFVRPGNSVFLDDSTTGLQLLPFLADLAPVTVISNAMFIQQAARDLDGVSLLVIGGDYQTWAEACFGPIATSVVDRLNADVCIMSATAVANGRCYHPDGQVAELKQHMINRSAKNILYTDHTKFMRTALHEVCPLNQFDVAIVDTETPPETVAALREQVNEVVIV